MLKNYLIIALRNLRRQPGYSLITILGLALGLAATMVILLHVRAELSYDASHEAADRLVRVTTTTAPEGQATTYATTVPALGPTLVEQLPEVLHATRILVEATESNEALFAAEDRRFYEARFAWVDSSFFDVFTFPFIAGNPQTALTRPFTVVLTETTAHRYFGEADAVGQILKWNEQLDLEVTGIIADMPERSHFHFDLLGSLQTFKGLGADGMIDNWGYRGFYTYLRLAEGQDIATVESTVAALVEARREETDGSAFRLQPVRDIHLRSRMEEEIEPNGSMLLVYVLGSIAGILLFIAGVNFINLTTARSARRAREIGVRKVMGAHRNQLIRQFLAESMLLALAGFLGALCLTLGLVPILATLMGTPRLPDSGMFFLGAAGIAFCIGILAGLYPAFYLSAFRPTDALRGLVHAGNGPAWLRSGLVATQFTLSITLIIGTGLVYQQLRFLRNADLGFDREQVVALPLHSVFGQPQQDVGQLREELLRIASVQEVAGTSQLPSRAFVNNWSARPEGAAPAEAQELTAFTVGSGFVETLGLDLLAGHDFAEAHGAEEDALLINEASARQFGWDQPVGKQFFASEGGAAIGTVVGVVRDFHYQSMRHVVGPSVFRQGQPADFQYLVVRLADGGVATAMAEVERVWEASTPDWPFSYLFLDDEFDAMYRSVEHTAWLVGLFSLLAICVACLGIVGLTAYAIEQRTKEFGIRKALGASFTDILVLLQKDHLKLLVLAFVLAVPLAYFAATRWLEEFAYRTDLSAGTFVLTGLVVCLIALATVGYQSIKAALTDPVQALRYE